MIMDTDDKKGMGLDIKPETAKGLYSNLAVISHSRSEFVLDFATILPGFPKPEVGSRVIMSPEHAKRLFLALQDNIIKYEGQFGPIDLDMKPKGTFNVNNFGPVGGGNPENKS